MIPKKTLRSTDPSDNRPISLLSCISKVLERIVKTRLYKFLENFDVILKQQSGFRNNRGTADNLLFFTQKISENLKKTVKPVRYSLISLRLLIRSGTKVLS